MKTLQGSRARTQKNGFKREINRAEMLCACCSHSPQAAGMNALLRGVVQKLFSWWQAAPPGALGGGILGLCLLVLGWWQLRGSGQAAAPRQQHPQTSQRASSRPEDAPPQQQEAPKATVPQASTPLARAVSSQLAGVKRITISAPGVLLEESDPHQLQESATVRPQACEIVREMCRVCEVTVMAHVLDDIGEAAITGAFEAAGLTGSLPGQLKPHRLLFCSTLDGKMSIVRQLEPDLHIDGSKATIDGLQRFIPQLLLVGSSAGQPSIVAANIGVAASLESHFGV